MLGEFERAVEFANEAIEIDPEFSLVYYALVMIHAEAGRVREARAAVESLLAIDPKFTGRAYNAVMRFRDPAIEARRLESLARAGMAG